MKPGKRLIQCASFLLALCLAAGAAQLTTVKNSNLSVTTATLAYGLGGSTNLTGSNFLLSAVAAATAQGGRATLLNSQNWVQRYNGGPGSFQNAVYDMTLRADGGAVVTGYSLRSGFGYDFVTIACAPDGTQLWENRYDGPGHGYDTARFVAANTNGDVWVVGESMRYETNSTLTDLVVLKYASSGVPAWTNRYSSFVTNGAYAAALAVDASDNAYVKYSAAFWQGVVGTPVEDAILKFDAFGNLVWAKHALRSAADSGQGLHDFGPMALDGAGRLLVAGSTGTGSFDTGNSIIKFDGDGSALWTNHLAFPFVDGIYRLSIDAQGNVIATGQRWTNSTRVYVAMKCSKDGVMLWTNSLAGPGYDGGNVPQTVPDLAGNVFMIGGSPGAASSGPYQILKVNSNGISLWTNQTAVFASTNGMISDSVVDSAGNLYLCGFSQNAGSGYKDFVTAKYSNGGMALWTNRYNGADNLDDLAFAMQVDGAGNVFAAGESEATAGNWDIATVKYANTLLYAPPRDFTGLDTINGTLFDKVGASAACTIDVMVMPGSFQFNLANASLTSTGMLLRVTGVPGTNLVVLEKSADLSSWQPILSNAPINGTVQFLDSGAAGFSGQVYRVFQEQ